MVVVADVVVIVVRVLVVVTVVTVVKVDVVVVGAMSQLSPAYPLTHLQEHAPVRPREDPPFAHGLPFAPVVHPPAVSHTAPPHPGSQLQLYEFTPSTQSP